MFRFQILGLLRNYEAAHGYALMKEYNRRTGRKYGAGYFYRQLGELVSGGFVRPARKTLGADPRRTPYRITEAGIEAFDEWFEEVPRDPVESDVLRVARAMFFWDVAPGTAARVLATWQRDLAEQARMLERDLMYLNKRAPEPGDMRAMLIQRDLHRVAGDLFFLDSVGATISDLADEARESADSPALGRIDPTGTPKRSQDP